MSDFASIMGVLPEPTRTFRFRDDAKVEIHGVDHKPQHCATNGVVFKRMDETNASVFLTHAEIQRLYDIKGDAIVVRPNFYADRSAKKRADGFSNLSALPIKRQEPIVGKEMWVRAVMQAEEENRIARAAARTERRPLPAKFSAKSPYSLDRELPRLRKSLEDRINALFAATSTYKNRKVLVAPSGRAVAGWVSEYQRSAHDPLALYEKYHERRDEYFEPDVLVYLKEALRVALSTAKPNLALRWRNMETEINAENERRKLDGETILAVPTYECLRQRWLSIPESVRDSARLGKEAANAKWSAVNRGQQILRPLELVQMDEYKTNLKTLSVHAGIWKTLTDKEKKRVKRLRLWITAAIDVASRCVVALKVHIAAPSLKTALTTLEMTTIDKTSIAQAAGCQTPWDMYGTLEELGVDSAAWLSSRAMRIAVNDLGATLFLPASGDASMRGTIERLFKTFGHMLFAYFTGQTGGSVAENGTYDSDAEASAMADMIGKVVVRFVVDGYHNKPHEGLNGATPRQRWIELEREWGVLPEPTGQLRRDIFGTLFDATLSRSGITKLGLTYDSRQIRTAFKRKAGTKVVCRLDRQDIGEISAWVDGAWVKVPCKYPELKGVSFAKWVAVCQKLKLFNRENASVPRKVFAETMSYMEKQAELAWLSAGLDSPIIDEEVLARVDRAFDRGFKFDDEKAPVETVALDGEWRPSNDFFEIMGISPVVYANPPKPRGPDARLRPGTKPVEKPKASRGTTTVSAVRESETSTEKHEQSVEALSDLWDDE